MFDLTSVLHALPCFLVCSLRFTLTRYWCWCTGERNMPNETDFMIIQYALLMLSSLQVTMLLGRLIDEEIWKPLQCTCPLHAACAKATQSGRLTPC